MRPQGNIKRRGLSQRIDKNITDFDTSHRESMIPKYKTRKWQSQMRKMSQNQ